MKDTVMNLFSLGALVSITSEGFKRANEIFKLKY